MQWVQRVHRMGHGHAPAEAGASPATNAPEPCRGQRQLLRHRQYAVQTAAAHHNDRLGLCDLAAQAAAHVRDHLVAGDAGHREQVRQLGTERLRRHVARLHDPDGLELLAQGVGGQIDRAAQALARGHDDDALVNRLGQRVDERALARRQVARAVQLEYNGPQRGRVLDGHTDVLVIKARHHAPHSHGGRQRLVHAEAPARLRQAQVRPEADAGLEQCEGREVGRVEGVQATAVHLDGAVAAHQLVIDENAHLGHVQDRRKHDGHDQVAVRVVEEVHQRQHRAREHDRLVQILQQKRQRGATVRHRVGAHHHHKPVVLVV